MYFDIIMPITLFAVTFLATFLNGKVEGKLKGIVEEREFRTRDAILLVVMISVAVSIIVFVPQYAIMAVFLFSYSTLLYMFSYIFSNIKRKSAQIFCAAFGLAALTAGIVGIIYPFSSLLTVYGTAAFFGLAAYAFILVIYEEKKPQNKERWHLGTLPPILFIFLYLFYNGTPVWFPYLLDTYGLTFAVLIILYIGTLFNWRNALLFAGLLTVMDIILVLFTGTMISAAKHVSGLGLPVLVSLPTLPLITKTQGILYMSLGLGDFFFAGILATQTLKKFGKQTTIIAIIAMCISFAIYEAYLLNSTKFVGFPGTLMIISGWLPVVGYELLKKKNQQ
jgi:hypothetical protein